MPKTLKVRLAISFFISILSAIHAQDTITLKQTWQQIAQTKDGTVKAFIVRDLSEDLYLILPHQKDEWLDRALNIKREWDTIQITHFTQPKKYEDEANKAFYTIDSCTLELFKVDSIGINGVIVVQYLSGHEHGVGETFDFSISEKQKTVEIWNLERVYGNPEKLFSAKPFCSEKHYRRLLLLPPNPRVKKIGAKKNTALVQLETNNYADIEYFYAYNLKANVNGSISITNIETDKEKWLKPDHEEGVYIFENGTYIIKKK